MSGKKIKVVELFAWVWGFRIGLSNASNNYNVVWSNQWEPSTKTQHASMVYEAKFWTENHSNEDISEVKVSTIPDHDLLVWGFPCQDYSVATTLKNSKGLLWKKWVLWWSIHKILSEKKNKPKYLFFENVDRLLKSPVKQRWRDFAVMLKTLDDLWYAVEWRVINAAEYGMPQRRRRIFFLWYHKSTEIYKELKKKNKQEWLQNDSVITDAFPIEKIDDSFSRELEIEGDLVSISEEFNKNWKGNLFENTGVFIDWKAYTSKTIPVFKWNFTTLWDILENWKVDESFYINKDLIDQWNYLKGAKKEVRVTSDGFEYNYSEGGMIFPDALDNSSRTIITWEGGKSPSRFKHVVDTKNGLRRLTPVELERLNMFPDNHTQLEGITDTKRAFFMWNALVTWVVERIWKSLNKKIK